MNPPPPPQLGALPLEPASASPLQEQVYGRLRQAIAEGRLAPGERLPSTRSLAAQLNVARGTVDAAYGRLAGEGYVVGRGAAGTVVAADLNAAALAPRAARAPTASYAPPDDYLWSFRGGLPALDLFPRVLWTGLVARAARRLDAPRFCYPDPRGLQELRVAIAGYLLVSRGIACDPSQVFVTGGYQAALQHVVGRLLRPGDEVWLEDPGYRLARRALEAAQMRVAPIPVDASGLDVGWARQRHAAARLAIVTPGHQSPLGVPLSLPRRQALLDWASDADAWVLEDDYDSEFHYIGRKPPALKSIDRRDRVFYAGSFSKTLFPGLRLGYLVVPVNWTAAVTNSCELLCRGQSTLEQAAVAAFIADGHYARHLRRMRLRYAERSAALTQALVGQFGSGIQLARPEGGLTLLARFPTFGPDTELVERARARGLAPSALSAHAVRHDAGSGMLLGFTNITPEQAQQVAQRLHEAISE
ncbi:MAG: PLP-dependent aminotransferase family protein [Burkholderiales bacterium]|jgi:GntR family transcriptional regulator/MocR family aminotransferase|nr:PLP-dependent aminotransferase family protein [Burkholderiales bacterium]